MKKQTVFKALKALIPISFLVLGFYFSMRSEEKIFMNKELRKTEYSRYIDDIRVIKHTMDTAIISFNIDLRPRTLTPQDVRDFNNCVKDIIDNSYITSDINDNDRKNTYVKIITITIAKDGNRVYLGSERIFDTTKQEFVWKDS